MTNKKSFNKENTITLEGYPGSLVPNKETLKKDIPAIGDMYVANLRGTYIYSYSLPIKVDLTSVNTIASSLRSKFVMKSIDYAIKKVKESICVVLPGLYVRDYDGDLFDLFPFIEKNNPSLIQKYSHLLEKKETTINSQRFSFEDILSLETLIHKHNASNDNRRKKSFKYIDPNIVLKVFMLEQKHEDSVGIMEMLRKPYKMFPLIKPKLEE